VRTKRRGGEGRKKKGPLEPERPHVGEEREKRPVRGYDPRGGHLQAPALALTPVKRKGGEEKGASSRARKRVLWRLWGKEK